MIPSRRLVAAALAIAGFTVPANAQWLPPTWAQPVAAAGRLAVVLLLAVAGAATLILVSTRDRVAK